MTAKTETRARKTRPPAMERILAHPAAASWIARFGREQVKRAAREAIPGLSDLDIASIVARAGELLEKAFEETLVAVINATGVLIHTNLGRSPLSEPARRAVERVAGRYSTLEYDRASGERGRRQEHVRHLLRRLLEVEDALAVNNNAAGVLLALAAVARGREVLVSRGELVAIGGSFKIPEILEASGARLREVGTTNRTTRDDYARALDPGVAAILTVHPSNYRISGFTQSVPGPEIAKLARAASVPWIHDQGSGCLAPLAAWGIADEPTAKQILDAGADLLTFSGDKLLGGPQAGIVAGRKRWIAALAAHPIARAVRPDKMTLAALAATLAEWIRNGPLDLPIYRLASAKPAELRRRAEAIVASVPAAELDLEVRASRSVFGGGTTPEQSFPSVAIRVLSTHFSAAALHLRLRAGAPPIIGRIEDGALWLDLTTVFPDEDDGIIEALRKVWS
jgi:L-seryl-tRNA(Ser) seleniumtransferase